MLLFTNRRKIKFIVHVSCILYLVSCILDVGRIMQFRNLNIEANYHYITNATQYVRRLKLAIDRPVPLDHRTC